MPSNHFSKQLQVALLLSLFSFSLSSGYLSGRTLSQSTSPVFITQSQTSSIPVIHINGVRNGMIYGNIQGNARLHIGNELFVQSGVFLLDAEPLLKNELLISIPSWAQFVASTRGSKYYPVYSSLGEQLSPKNRVYFATEEAARAAGYR